MIYYMDTSALMKMYLEEAGSDAVRGLISEVQFRITSALTQLEVVSAIELAKRMRRINSPGYRTHLASLNADIKSGAISLIEITASILKKAISLIQMHRLRPPDAIQLATALESRIGYEGEIHFLCADRALLDAARREGLRCKDVSR